MDILKTIIENNNISDRLKIINEKVKNKYYNIYLYLYNIGK